MMSLGDSAAELGVPVFPCDKDKRPVTPHGHKDATTDPDAIPAAFARPGAELIGMPTGSPSGLIVIDVDIRADHTGMDWLEVHHERLPPTRTSKTPSGGLHLYFLTPLGVEIRNSASRIAPGIDVRGEGGYVIVPPSPGYTIADAAPPAEMPAWLVLACTRQEAPQPPLQPPRSPRQDGGTPYGLSALQAECEAVRAADWGQQENTLNSAGLKLGALIAGGELEQAGTIADLIAAGRCMVSQPGKAPWCHRAIEDKIRRAIQDGMASPRSPPERPAAARYTNHHHQTHTQKAPQMAAGDSEEGSALHISDESWDETTLPTRPWIAKTYLIRRSVSVLAGIGSGGKSGLTICWALALVFDIVWSRLKPCGHCIVSLYNAEDDDDEQRLRISAALIQFDKSPSDLKRRLYRLGPTNVGTLIERDPVTRQLRFTAAMDQLIQHLECVRPDVLILDPLIALHNADENDNTAVRTIMAQFRALAVRFNMAVLLTHHVRKGGGSSPGDADVIRGGSDIVGASRVALTLTVMSEEEAKDLGVNSNTRRSFFRIDGAKQNYAPIGTAEWFERIEQTLSNGEGSVAIYPWVPPNVKPSMDLIVRALAGIAAGHHSGPWSPRMGDEVRSFRTLAVQLGVEKGAAQKALLDSLKHSHGVREGDVPRGGGKAKSDTMKGLRTADGAPHNWEWVA